MAVFVESLDLRALGFTYRLRTGPSTTRELGRKFRDLVGDSRSPGWEQQA